MHSWSGFYTVMGGAAAALLGLLFVSVSVNAATALRDDNQRSKRLAEQAFQNYLAVILVSLLALFPGMSTPTFGVVTLCVTAVWAVLVVVRFYQAIARVAEPDAHLYGLPRHFSSVLGFGMLVTAAVRMALAWGDNDNLFASAALVLLFSATQVSWEFLNKLARSDPRR